MKDFVSPEEKLLKLIKGEKKHNPPVPKLQQRPGYEKKYPPISELKSRIKNFIYTSAQKHLNFRYILAAAYFFMGVSFIYLAASLIYPLVGLKRIKLPTVSNYNAKEFPEIAQAQEPKPLEFYLEGLSNKRIFANQGFPDINAAASAQGLALTKDVNLIGIISGDSPQAIIEDKREQKTYYLTKGQFFGEMMVEDIQADRIIINYKGSRFELYL